MRRQIRGGLVVFRLLILAIAVFTVPGAVFAAPRTVATAPAVSDADRAILGGPWHGTWAGHNFRYDAAIALNVDATGNVVGTITWTLRASPSADGAKKIGLKGVENVRGTYYPNSATFVLEGYAKADPNDILALDKYLLVVSPTRQTMGGLTEDHGEWTGQFYLSHDEQAAPADALHLPPKPLYITPNGAR